MNNETKPLRKLSRACPYGGELSEEERERSLQLHPEWRTTWEERDRQDAIVVEALREQAFLDVQSVYDLVNTPESYPEAIPILLHLLPEISEPKIKEGIVRALTVKEARGIAARPLIEEFKRIDVPPRIPEPEGERDRYGHLIRDYTPEERRLYNLSNLKWLIGNALSVVADESVTDEIVELLMDKRHGGTRSALLHALLRLKPANRIEILLELLDDEDDGVSIQAALVLGRLRVQAARDKIADRFLTHPDSWFRQQAKRALAKLDKARQG
jgi:HEAT repeat protein